LLPDNSNTPSATIIIPKNINPCPRILLSDLTYPLSNDNLNNIKVKDNEKNQIYFNRNTNIPAITGIEAFILRKLKSWLL